MEEWLATAGDWRQSRLYQRMTAKKTERKHGARVWLTRAQLLMKYGSQEIVDEIVTTKLSDPELRESHTKSHPDAPQSEARQIMFLFKGMVMYYAHAHVRHCMAFQKKTKHHVQLLAANS